MFKLVVIPKSICLVVKLANAKAKPTNEASCGNFVGIGPVGAGQHRSVGSGTVPYEQWRELIECHARRTRAGDDVQIRKRQSRLNWVGAKWLKQLRLQELARAGCLQPWRSNIEF